ncbi:vacuolar protein sorting-associated protein 8 homolog [Musca domestica]|uniref:Vacuolar protein sorting-associated protein 8 homolog n=1 Tax=Musca domestica TaxID=7370 RepID=A0A9J7CUF6_MUSDO|nr:vacuolar protein sorting-associated protein 8 homolog [Musca domestica]
MNELKAPSLNSLLGSDRGSTDSLLAESLIDVEELDDVEYSIPPPGALPSLEKVLSEFEEDSDIASELGIPTPSIAEEGSVRMGGIGGGGGGGGSIMRYAMLQGVSTQLTSASDRIGAGMASSCAVCNHYYAVGTSHGHILNFDATQTLRWAHQDKNGQGAVSSLSFNPECNRLLAGFARGLVLMLDTQTGDIMRQLFDVVTPNTGILHVKWTSRPAMALAADSGGSVWSLSFTRKLGVRGCSTRCLFSGARGEVCAVEPLLSQTGEHHDLDQYCIVALATLSKYFIVTIRPRLKVIKYHLLQGPPDCLPVLAWQMVLIQAADATRSVDPVLVVGRGNQLFFHQLFISHGRITLLLLRHITMQTNILSAHWLGPKCVGCIDTSEILHLLDVRSSKELECIDLGNASMVYGSAQFKGLATGGNVSPALALAGTHACYNSLAARGVQLYVLGSRSMHLIGVRTWMERITYLVKNHRWQEACDLALDGYRAAGDRPKRKLQAKERIIMLFKEYIAASARAPDYCLGAIIKCLIVIDELELLWTQLWERLQNKELFLHHITQHIENDDIHQVNPIISQALVDYWLKISPAKLEDVILKMDWTCLDLNQVLKAARKHKLYKAQIYLNANALHDYTMSLTELIPLIGSEPPDLGNCLLVYISSCLAGRGYPQGDIPEELIQNVKHDVLRCLTSLHSTTSEPNEMPYPYLRALLKFDTRETLNVISLAFQEKEFSGELGYSQRKRIINILLEIMTPENNTWSEIGCLLNFIAQQISESCLPCDTQLLEKVLNYLSMESIENESSRLHSERENAWYELLVNNCLNAISNDEEQLQLAKKAHCYYVQEYLLEKLQRYDEILSCYISNPLRHETMFVYMERYARETNRKIYQQLKQHLRKLLEIDGKETTRIVDLYFRDMLEELLQLLEDDERFLFIFLKQLQQRNDDLTAEQSEKLIKFLCKYEPMEVEEFLKACNCYRIDAALDLVMNYKLLPAAVFLAEKQSDYKLAFHLALEILKNASPEQMEECAKSVSALCSRSSLSSKSQLTEKERESLWFELLKYILPLENLKNITKSMLHEASQHVDLTNLVQLVMNTHNVSGNFGDIKELLLSMLNQSKAETNAMEIAMRILEKEVAEKFHQRKKQASRGLLITMMQCVVCKQRLYNQAAIIIVGSCGHAMHGQCSIEFQRQHHMKFENGDYDDDSPSTSSSSRNISQQLSNNLMEDAIIMQCPYCLCCIEEQRMAMPVQLAKPSHNVVNYNNQQLQNANNGKYANTAMASPYKELGVLHLKSPPRKF